MTTKDITPNDSVCPIFLQPWTDDEVAANQAAEQRRTSNAAARATAREALLTKLGITADEAQLLLGGM